MGEPSGGGPLGEEAGSPGPRSFQARRFDKGDGFTLDGKPWEGLGEVSVEEQGDFGSGGRRGFYQLLGEFQTHGQPPPMLF